MHANRKIGFVAVVTTWALISVPGVVGQSKTGQVVVVNSSSQPVPTAAQGTTNVTGTVNLSSGSTVNIGNTPNVSVANTPSVNVANTPTVSLAAGTGVIVTNPLDGQNNPTPLATLDAIQPYEAQCSVAFNGLSSGLCNFATIPAGKRLVIQEFDASGSVDSGLKPIFVIVTGSNLIGHAFTATFMGTNAGLDFFATHQETRLYSSASAIPTCFIRLSGISNNGGYSCQVSGFLVDGP